MHNSAATNRHSDGPVILKFDPSRERISRSRQDEQTLGQYIPLIYHYNMLQDEERVGAFRAAIASIVQPGMRVLELGSGTGILSSFAARQGATVDAVERNPELVDCSRRFLSANGLQGRVRVVAADAAQWVPDHPVDVVICEMLHVGLLREKQAQVISTFKHNYARRFGPKLPVFIPEVSILMCQPVQYDFDFAGFVAPVPSFHAPTQFQPRTHEIASLATYETVDYGQAIPAALNASESFIATAGGVVNAIRLVTQNVLAVDVESQSAVTWPNQCLILPINAPLECSEGEVVDVTMEYEAGATIESIRYNATSRTSVPHRKAG
ncbi:MAG: methyltransferase domain-containing protein [Pirellulaceae bacterium]